LDCAIAELKSSVRGIIKKGWFKLQPFKYSQIKQNYLLAMGT
jgi:hypothetical protein